MPYPQNRDVKQFTILDYRETDEGEELGRYPGVGLGVCLVPGSKYLNFAPTSAPAQLPK